MLFWHVSVAFWTREQGDAGGGGGRVCKEPRGSSETSDKGQHASSTIIVRDGHAIGCLAAVMVHTVAIRHLAGGGIGLETVDV